MAAVNRGSRTTRRRVMRTAIAVLIATVSLSSTAEAAAPTGEPRPWGSNDYGQGQGGVPPSALGASAVSAGGITHLALKDGGVIAWGNNSYLQTEIPAAATSGVSAIAAGWAHELALKNGGVIAWGNGFYGQNVVPAAATSGVTAISTSMYFNLALKQNGSVLSWGSRTAVPATVSAGVTAISAGGDHGLALKNGGVVGWGANGKGQITVPAAATSGVTAISAGFRHSIALKNGGVLAWGDNSYGQATVPPEAQSDVIALDAGLNHNVVLKADGSVFAWGSNVKMESRDTSSEPPTEFWKFSGVCAPVYAVSAGDSTGVALVDPNAPMFC